MGGSFLSGTAATTPTCDSYYPAKPEIDETARARANWNYNRRGPVATLNPNPWVHLWPRGASMSGDPSSPMDCLGSGQEGGNYFEPPSCIGNGTQTTRFIKGTCVDASDVAVASAIVQGFITATDVFVGEVTANTDGTYTLPTATVAGVAHYLVAYKAGSPDIAGTTVNTITSTNVDGT